jgi:hypothetical protein
MGDDANRRPRVAIEGGGFAGPSAVRALDGADVDPLLVAGPAISAHPVDCGLQSQAAPL